MDYKDNELIGTPIKILIAVSIIIFLVGWYKKATIVPDGCEPTLYYNGHTQETLYNCMSIGEAHKWIKSN